MMEICRRLDQFDPPCDRPLAIAVGTFDGVHLGHQWIIRQVTEWADRRHGVPGVFTFTNHPRAVLTPEKAPRLITPPALKARILARLGIGILVSIEFTAAFAQTEPEFFLDEVLVRGLGVRALMVGFNFGFGRDRRGTAELLARLGARRGLEVTVIPPVRVEGAIVQSTKIRELLMGGDLGKARALLGRSYALLGTVMPGAGRGSSLGFRTANLVAPADLLLPDGVYVATAYYAGRGEGAVVNIGWAPTFDRDRRLVEVHLLESPPSPPGYGQELLMTFHDRLREERRFPSPEKLREQIAADVKRARGFLAEVGGGLEDWALQASGAVLHS